MADLNRIKDVIKKLPLVRYWLSPIQSWQAGQLKRRKQAEALAFEELIGKAFSNVEDGSLVESFLLHPGFIKIDTEGAELLVLRGAAKTLREEHPVLLLELSDQLLASLDCSSQQVFALLRECGYRLMNADEVNGAISSPFEGSVLALPEVFGKTN